LPSVRISIDSRPAFVIETYGKRDAIVSAAIEKYRYWDAASTRVARELLRHEVDFVDVGANIGWFTLVAADALRSRGWVHSFEPDPRHVAKLSASVRRNRFRNVSINGWALSDYDGEGRLFRSEDNFGDHRMFDFGPKRRSQPVAVHTLDSYGRLAAGRPLVLKLDVQGSEARVLQGARRLLEGHEAEIVMLCEIAPHLLVAAGTSLEALVSRLRELGFLPALIDHNRAMVHPLTWERLVLRCRQGVAEHPEHEADVLLFRRHDGIAASALQLGRG
jgi:FkbM family methyltransferase